MILPTEPEELLLLTADILEDEELLGVWVDDVIRRDPPARTRAAEIEQLVEVVRCVVDADVWMLFVEVERRCTQRWADLASVLVQHGFEAGRRHLLEAGEVAP